MGDNLEPQQAQAGLSLLFAPGSRPGASDIAQLMAASVAAGQVARVSHQPADDHGRIELLASGLTFELRGLAPGSAAPMPPVGQVYGLPADLANFELEAVSLTPGPHVAAGGAMMPVVRVLIGLAADLVLQLPIAAVCWNPAQCWMDPKYFGRIVVNWLSGGPFPVLGLTSVRANGDGLVESSGLEFFTGQEVRVRQYGEPAPETTKLAARIIDHLVRHGPLDALQKLVGPNGEDLVAEPSADRRLVLVSRAA